jgi:glycosyltransferase involved in cell wall biosynthesis
MREDADHIRSWVNWVRRRPVIPRGPVGGRVLLISYIFPPTGGSAVQRPAKLVKYLPSAGWTVEVLTAGHDRFPWRDDSLLSDIPPDCRVHRVPGYEPACVAERIAAVLGRQPGDEGDTLARHIEDSLQWRLNALLARLGIEDAQSLWVRPAARFATRRHRQAPFDVVISTGPPHFVHRVAWRMARQTNVPWIADVRDPLISDFDRTPAGRRKTLAMRKLEQAIMTQAAMIITTCPSFVDELRHRYPGRAAEDIRCITNGFDRDDLQLLEAEDVARPRDAVECVFVAAGAFYGRREVVRIVEPLRRVLERHPAWRDRVRLVIAGTLDAEQHRRWQQDRPEWLTLAGYLDHREAVRLAVRSACAIVPVPDCRHGNTSIPGKTFELMALPVHILALAPPDGDTARIVAGAGASTIAPFEDAAQVASAMEGIITDHFAGRLASHRAWDRIDCYDRLFVAADFARCLERVSSKASSPLDGGIRFPSDETRSAFMSDNSLPALPGRPPESARPDLCHVSI